MSVITTALEAGIGRYKVHNNTYVRMSVITTALEAGIGRYKVHNNTYVHTYECNHYSFRSRHRKIQGSQ